MPQRWGSIVRYDIHVLETGQEKDWNPLAQWASKFHFLGKPVATCIYKAFSTQVIKKYSRLQSATAANMKVLSFLYNFKLFFLFSVTVACSAKSQIQGDQTSESTL